MEHRGAGRGFPRQGEARHRSDNAAEVFMCGDARVAVEPQIPLATPIQPTQNHMFAGKPIRRLGMIVDESTLDIPTFKRRAGGDPGPSRVGQTESLENDDKLEIPAFLRKPSD